MCVRVCMRACVCACMRACARVCVYVSLYCTMPQLMECVESKEPLWSEPSADIRNGNVPIRARHSEREKEGWCVCECE